ncbi:MAG TPA: TIR domain-containing protein, partial [Pyrinomonadaceae bacterium]|nr:TIR domain-containing protein [Pyrinomonadaceae bacterium]
MQYDVPMSAPTSNITDGQTLASAEEDPALKQKPPDIFICYSLADEDFVRELERTLRERGRRVRLDGNSDLLTKEQEKKDYSLIDAAEHFLFVVSPNSVASKPCNKKLDHAAKSKKRILPVVRREVSESVVHESLRGPGKIFFRQGDDFESAFETLSRALESDSRYDAFISYSRKDQQFVSALAEALAKSGKRAWLDRKDILHSDQWQRAIYSGIEAANNFVFVVSPDSIESENCGKELAHAVKYNKRLVPILHRDTPPSALHPKLAEIDWIPFRAADDFKDSLRSLTRALDTDLDYVRAHTRLLTRAVDWERAGREKSLLLQGKDLREARRWLREAGTGKEPRPTPAQAQYVAASRKTALRRLAVTLTAVVVALTAIAVVARMAWQRQKRSKSQQLAASALSQLPVDPELSLLLAMEAARVMPTTEAEDALRQALLKSRLRVVLREHSDPVVGAAFSPDGKLAVTCGGETARIWEAASGRTI